VIVRILGAHNLESRTTRHTCFLIDGTLAVDAGGLTGALSLEEQADIRAVLLTHEHLDHSRDLPTLGLATLDDPRQIDVYGLPETLEGVRAHLMDGRVYPDLTKKLSGTPPRYRLHSLKPGSVSDVLQYQVKPVPVSHPVPAVGYIVRAADGACVAFTGDTGGSILQFFTDALSPETLFVDVTFPNRLEERANVSGHLTPALLARQLHDAAQRRLRTPRIIPVHLGLQYRNELADELAAVGSQMGMDLTPGREDMLVT